MSERWLAMLVVGLPTLATTSEYAFIPLSGTISPDTTLVAGEVYHLNGSVEVIPGVTLTIRADTIVKSIEFQQSSSPPGFEPVGRAAESGCEVGRVSPQIRACST